MITTRQQLLFALNDEMSADCRQSAIAAVRDALFLAVCDETGIEQDDIDIAELREAYYSALESTIASFGIDEELIGSDEWTDTIIAKFNKSFVKTVHAPGSTSCGDWPQDDGD